MDSNEWISNLISSFLKEEENEKESILTNLFERYNKLLETEKGEGDYLFCSLDYESLKDFYSTMRCILKLLDQLVLKINENGMFATNLQTQNDAKNFFRLELFPSFFSLFEMESGLEIETDINLSALCHLIEPFTKKESCDTLYLLFSNSCLAICSIKRNEKERKFNFLINKKVCKEIFLNENNFDSTVQNNQCFYEFSSERLIKFVLNGQKEKRSTKIASTIKSFLYMDFDAKTQKLLLANSNEMIKENKYTEIFLDQNNESKNWKGIFFHPVLFQICKVAPNLTFGFTLDDKAQPLLQIKITYYELIQSKNQISNFIIQIPTNESLLHFPIENP